MNLSLDGFVGNTFNSHRLVAYAATQSLEKADEVMGRLLEATHAEVFHNPSPFSPSRNMPFVFLYSQGGTIKRGKTLQIVTVYKHV